MGTRRNLVSSFNGDEYLFFGTTKNNDVLWLLKDKQCVDNECDVLMLYTFSCVDRPQYSKSNEFYNNIYKLDLDEVDLVDESKRSEILLYVNSIKHVLNNNPSAQMRNKVVNDLASYIITCFT